MSGSIRTWLAWRVTVTTVGYRDCYPVTIFGRIAAVFIMATGILTLAVVTAQVASSFVDQGGRRRPDATTVPTSVTVTTDVTLADLAERLARIEALLSPRNPEGDSVPGRQ